ncbi:MAG: acyl-CoA dehydrogenase, partial [Bacteroidetes bacterium]
MLSPDEFSTQLDSYTARALPDTWLHSLYARRWFKLFLPAAYGGLALPLNQALEILFETAACQGSLGWVVNLGSGAGYFWPFMSPETATAVYGA